MKVGDYEIKWLGHSGFLLKNSRIVYIDPYNVREGLEKADLILITHNHYDHCSFADLQKVARAGTRIIAPADCQSKIARFDFPIKIEIIEQGQEIDLGDLKILAVPAYNIDKTFHTKESGGLGYVIKTKESIIYHAGDTDLIPEMSKLTGFGQSNKMFVALLPIGGRFTMSVEEAVEAAKIIKPTVAIPMHYGSIVGDETNAKEFEELCSEEGITSKILEKE